MKIRMIGKSSGTVGNKMIHVRGTSCRRFSFSKRPGEGYIYETKDEHEAEELFQTQNNRFAYYFEPVFESLEKGSKDSVSFDDLDLEGLKKLCKDLDIEVLPQDKERSLKRLLTAYNKGCS